MKISEISNIVVGQMSGQWVKPKNTRNGWPLKSSSVTVRPFWSVRLNGPPIAATCGRLGHGRAPVHQQHDRDAEDQSGDEGAGGDQDAGSAKGHCVADASGFRTHGIGNAFRGTWRCRRGSSRRTPPCHNTPRAPGSRRSTAPATPAMIASGRQLRRSAVGDRFDMASVIGCSACGHHISPDRRTSTIRRARSGAATVEIRRWRRCRPPFQPDAIRLKSVRKAAADSLARLSSIRRNHFHNSLRQVGPGIQEREVRHETSLVLFSHWSPSSALLIATTYVPTPSSGCRRAGSAGAADRARADAGAGSAGRHHATGRPRPRADRRPAATTCAAA